MHLFTVAWALFLASAFSDTPREIVITERIEIDEFIQRRNSTPIVDVRSPHEFAEGHVPGALNLPLMDDEERAAIGTEYQQSGRQAAIFMGLELIGPRLRTLAEEASSILSGTESAIVYCARGGMRSEYASWLLERTGLKISRLEGGYKRFRNYVLASFESPWNLTVLTGLTGAGKTIQLDDLRQMGEQVIDLEDLAHHRGSAFGGIGKPTQPRTQQFENRLWDDLSQVDSSKRIWVEDESRSIGKCMIPHAFFDQLHAAPAIFMKVPLQCRIDNLVEEYGELDTEEMIESTEKIRKRLGGQNVKAAVEAIESGDLRTCTEILLVYYDKTYRYSHDNNPREVTHEIETAGLNRRQISEAILEVADKIPATTASN